jgi:5-methyltetrahydropteroyltriglutamate--homocysteine methyltransferase
MPGLKPPFRADHVGSLLRPAELRDARLAHSEGRLDSPGLKAVEDRAIATTIAKQESIGLRGITDGEYRRAYWHYDFLDQLDGIDLCTPAQSIAFKGIVLTKALEVTSKVRYSPHPMVGHFRFVQAHTKATAKITIPSPSVVHFRGGRKAISREVYPEMAPFYEDLGNAYRAAVSDFAAAGCRYFQLDEVNLAYLCDPEQRQMLRDRGDNPDELPALYARLINTAISGRSPEMTITMHLCRGNFRSSWIAQGGYEPVAEVLFNQIAVDGYFMEWDSDRAGGFEPLRFVPKDKFVVLGVVTSKTGALESKDYLKRRIDEASKFLPLDQLCLSPQCGFASTEEGNLLTEDEQWAKLVRIVEVAGEVWGA